MARQKLGEVEEFGYSFNVGAEWTSTEFGIRRGRFIKGDMDIGTSEGAIPRFCDKCGAIQSASNIGLRGRTKRVGVNLKCTGEYV